MIRKVGNEYCLFSKDGSKRLGCHPTRAAAVRQERALQVRKKASELLRTLREDSRQIRLPGLPRNLFDADNDSPTPSREFLKNLMVMLKGQLTEEAFNRAVRKARSRSGGVMRGRAMKKRAGSVHTPEARKKRRKDEDSKEKKMGEGASREFDVFDVPHVDPAFMLGERLAKDHDSVKYRESEVNPDDVADGTAGPSREQARCGTCAFWRFGLCQLVEGSIDAFFTCDLFKPPARQFGEKGPHDMVAFCGNEHGDHRLFFELRSGADSKPTGWIPYLPKPGMYRHPRYGDIVLTRERNAHFVDQFSNRVYGQNLPIDVEHAIELGSDGRHKPEKDDVVAAYVTKMRQTQDGSVEAFVEWTDDGMAILKKGTRRYFSPQWLEAWKDPTTSVVHTDVAIGGALTSRPFFKERSLKPLVASERGLVAFRKKETTMPDNKKKSSDVDPKAQLIERAMKAVDFEGTAEEFREQLLGELIDDIDLEEFTASEGDEGAEGEGKGEKVVPVKASELRQLREENTKLKEAGEQKTGDLNAMSERVQKLERETLERHFNDVFDGLDPKTGKRDERARFFGDRKKKVGFMVKLHERGDKQEVDDYIEENRRTVIAMSESDLTRQLGNQGGEPDTGDPVATAQARIREAQGKDPKLSFSEAEEQVFKADPQLADRYESAMRGQ